MLYRCVTIAMLQKVPLSSSGNTTLYQFISRLAKPAPISSTTIDEAIREFRLVKQLIKKMKDDKRIALPKRHELMHEVITSLDR